MRSAPQHPLDAMAEELAISQTKLSFWRLLCGLLLFTTLFASAATGVSVHIGMQTTKELASFKGECIRPETAESMIHMTDRLSEVNDICINAHRRHMGVLREALPGLFIDEDRVTPWGLYAENGGEYAGSKEEDVPEMRTRKAIGGVLPGEEP